MTTFISFTGNLAKAPELRTDKNGRPYTFARVIRTDRVNKGGEFEDGGTEGYDVAVWGADAEALCDIAERCGNVRVTSQAKSCWTPTRTTRATPAPFARCSMQR